MVVLHVHVVVDLLVAGRRDAIDIADIRRTVRVIRVAHDTRDDTARGLAVLILAADVDFRRRAITANLDRITLFIRVDEITRRLEARVQIGQVLTDGLAALDVGTIFVDMDFLVERVARNQARIASSNLARAFHIDRVGRRRRVRAFHLRDRRILAIDHCDRILGNIMDSRLAGIREVAILDLSDLVRVVRHLLRDSLVSCLTSLLLIVELLAVDSIFAVLAQSTILDIGDDRAILAAQRDFRLVGTIILHSIFTEVLHVVRDILDGLSILCDIIGIGLDLRIEST